MINFGLINENNILTNTIVIPEEQKNKGQEYIAELNIEGKWVDLSNRTHRTHLGFFYDEENDRFIPPKPFNSWTLNEETLYWQPPIPHPANNDKEYYWDEEKTEWVLSPTQSSRN